MKQEHKVNELSLNWKRKDAVGGKSKVNLKKNLKVLVCVYLENAEHSKCLHFVTH